VGEEQPEDLPTNLLFGCLGIFLLIALQYSGQKNSFEYFSFLLSIFGKSRDSSVGIVTGYGLDNYGVGFESWWGQEFSLLHVVQTGPGTHPASYPMGTGGSFPRGKAAVG
jgi:hypothetical protein